MAYQISKRYGAAHVYNLYTESASVETSQCVYAALYHSYYPDCFYFMLPRFKRFKIQHHSLTYCKLTHSVIAVLVKLPTQEFADIVKLS